jgi:hypothetical protein
MWEKLKDFVQKMMEIEKDDVPNWCYQNVLFKMEDLEKSCKIKENVSVYVLFRNDLRTGHETLVGVYSSKDKAEEEIKDRCESADVIEYSIVKKALQ